MDLVHRISQFVVLVGISKSDARIGINRSIKYQSPKKECPPTILRETGRRPNLVSQEMSQRYTSVEAFLDLSLFNAKCISEIEYQLRYDNLT